MNDLWTFIALGKKSPFSTDIDVTSKVVCLNDNMINVACIYEIHWKIVIFTWLNAVGVNANNA